MKITAKIVWTTLSIFKLSWVASKGTVDEPGLERRNLGLLFEKVAQKKQLFNKFLGIDNQNYDKSSTSNDNGQSHQTNIQSKQQDKYNGNSKKIGDTIIINNQINNYNSKSANSKSNANSDSNASSRGITSQNNQSSLNQSKTTRFDQRENRAREQRKQRDCSFSSIYTCKMTCGPKNVVTTRICSTTRGSTRCYDDSKCNPAKENCLDSYESNTCYCQTISCSPPSNLNYQQTSNQESSIPDNRHVKNQKPLEYNKGHGNNQRSATSNQGHRNGQGSISIDSVHEKKEGVSVKKDLSRQNEGHKSNQGLVASNKGLENNQSSKKSDSVHEKKEGVSVKKDLSDYITSRKSIDNPNRKTNYQERANFKPTYRPNTEYMASHSQKHY